MPEKGPKVRETRPPESCDAPVSDGRMISAVVSQVPTCEGEFATTWPEYELDAKTRALLGYASKLTETPSLVDKEDIGLLRDAGWDERAIWEITALASFFNFSGRLEAASGLPPDQIPEDATFAEAKST